MPERSALLSISVIVPTRDRPDALSELLKSLAEQSYVPGEIIIVEDSPLSSAKQVIERFIPHLKEAGCRLEYIKGTTQGNTVARNLGISSSTGAALLFLDDDVLLEPETVKLLATHLVNNPKAMGVQPLFVGSGDYWESQKAGVKLENAIYKVLMLSYHERNRQGVRRSGTTIYPSVVTRCISVQRFSGCSLIRRQALPNPAFDTNLRRWGLYDDLDFSYRIFLRHPGSLHCIPDARIIHKHSPKARLPRREAVSMSVVYWCYIFFKDLYQGSLTNIVAFLWAWVGYLAWLSIDAVIHRDRAKALTLAYLISAYATTTRNLRSIRKGNIEFFNNTL